MSDTLTQARERLAESGVWLNEVRSVFPSAHPLVAELVGIATAAFAEVDRLSTCVADLEQAQAAYDPTDRALTPDEHNLLRAYADRAEVEKARAEVDRLTAEEAAAVEQINALAEDNDRLDREVKARAGDVARIAWFLRSMNLTASEAAGEQFVQAVWRRGVRFSDGEARLKAEARDIAASEARLALTKAADAIERGDWRDQPADPGPSGDRVAELRGIRRAVAVNGSTPLLDVLRILFPPDPRDARIAALEAEVASLRAVADTVTGGGSR